MGERSGRENLLVESLLLRRFLDPIYRIQCVEKYLDVSDTLNSVGPCLSCFKMHVFNRSGRENLLVESLLLRRFLDPIYRIQCVEKY